MSVLQYNTITERLSSIFIQLLCLCGFSRFFPWLSLLRTFKRRVCIIEEKMHEENTSLFLNSTSLASSICIY